MDGRWTSDNFTVSWHSHGPWKLGSFDPMISPVFMTKSPWLMVFTLVKSCEIPSFHGEIHWNPINPHRSVEISRLKSPINPPCHRSRPWDGPAPTSVRKEPGGCGGWEEGGHRCVGSPGLYPWGLREGTMVFSCFFPCFVPWKMVKST
jgi:hypothetical protein